MPLFPDYKDFKRLESKVDSALSLIHVILSKELAEVTTVQDIKQQSADLLAEVRKETDEKQAIAIALQGMQKLYSDTLSELKVAIANGANADDLNTIASNMTAALNGVQANEATDAVFANTKLDPNAGNPNGQPAPAPSVASISPTSGAAAGGDTVTISGTGFNNATAVNFGADSANSFSVIDDNTITAVSPGGAAGISAAVTVTGPTGTSAETPQYSYA